MDDDIAPEEIHGGFLAEFGATLIKNGYQIVPISGGEKVPRLKDWSNMKATTEDLKKWLSPRGGFLDAGGVGVLAKNSPAIDVDIRDEKVADQVEAFIREHLGDAPMRVGRKPKRLFAFKTDTPFPKITSKKYVDMFGDKHQVEILGDGQQYVAYHIHPDTGRPYIWPEGNGIAQTKREDLINISHDTALAVVRFFEQIAGQIDDWTEVRGSGRTGKGGGATDEDRMFSNMLKTDVALPDMAKMLMDVPDNGGYDRWIGVGMALHFEYEGSEDAFEAWCAWASGHLDYDYDLQCEKWETFGKNMDRKDALGGAFIISLYRAEIDRKAEELVPQLITNFHEARTSKQWEEAARAVQVAEISYLKRQEIVGIAKKKLDHLTNATIPLAQVRKELAYKPEKRDGIPSWLEGWVYDTENDLYMHIENKMCMTKQAFAARFDREALTKEDILNGKSAPTFDANELALKVFKIETVHGRRYGPGELPTYFEEGILRANTYAEYQIPKVPEAITPRDKINIKRLKNHIKHLIEDPKEQRMLIDWLSWVVQNPGGRINYVCFIQGTPGDGKSFFGQLMRAVMGHNNVRLLSASVLEANFNGWAVGQCLTCIEEVRITGEKKYEIMNKMKDIIANPYIGVTFKGKESDTLRNTTSYMEFSNYQDALPVDETERRYLVLFSRWQSPAALREFMEENPDYYSNLYAAIDESPGAIRQFLLEHEQAPSFNPKGHAPRTPWFEMMRQKALPSFVQQVIEACEDQYCDGVSFELLNMQILGSYFRENDFPWPAGKAAANMLTMNGWFDLGRIKFDGNRVHFYTRNPDRFRLKGGNAHEFDVSAIRKFADEQLSQL